MIVSGCVLVCLFLACVEMGGSLGLKGAELPDLSPFRVVVVFFLLHTSVGSLNY